MAHEFIKAPVMVDAAVGLATPQAQLIHTVWKDLGVNYQGEVGPEGDTVSVRLPGIIGNAKDLGFRDQGRQIQTETIKRRKFDVTLDTYPYQAVDLLREEQTLDIADYGAQVLNPMAADVVEFIEAKMATTITGATYEKNIAINPEPRALYKAIVKGNEFLDDHGVASDRRWLVIGTGLHTATKLDDAMIDVHRSGTDQLLRQGEIGMLDGLNVMVSRRIGKFDAYIYHPTAFPTVLRAPKPARSVPFGASTSHDGIALTYWESLNPDRDSDRAFLGTFMGTGVLKDPLDPKKLHVNHRLLRAVKLSGDPTPVEEPPAGGDGE